MTATSLAPGQEVLFALNGASGTVAAAGARTIDVSGTGSQVLEMELLAGN